jgi:tetratricopeptide (TPR) repeat protein
MEAVWPDVHVSEDSLFQCIRELRSALGDDNRQLIKAVPGRGYLFEASVSSESDGAASAALPPTDPENGTPPAGKPRLLAGWQPRWAIGLLAGLMVLVGLTVAAPALLSRPSPATVAVTRIIDSSGDPAGASMAVAVTHQLVDGLAAIDNIHVVAPGSETSGLESTYVIDGELGKDQQSWTLKVRMIERATGEVRSAATVSVDIASLASQLQQSHLAAGVGDILARRLNALLEDGSSYGTATTSGKVAIEQASASINQTTRERFAAAQTMLEGALAAEPDNTDLQVALAGLQMRGIQMAWYDRVEQDKAESNARTLLDRAIAARPRSIAVLEARCRLLSATNAFIESLVTCGQATSFDPWNGSVLYLVGLDQLYLGRFEDALATFETADRYDTPAVSRWTWLLGAGWANLMLGRNAEAVSWLQRSIAVTPASGRTQMTLAVAYQRLGRLEEAKAAMAEGLRLRPGSTAANVRLPLDNASPAFIAASIENWRTMVLLGLPDH